MKKVLAAILTLCLITIVVPSVSDESSNADLGISTCEYSKPTHLN